MNLFNPFLIKKYESILARNPKSKIFSPLAQIYRLKKDLKKAQAITLQGIKYNPTYATGYILLAKIYKDLKDIPQALKTLSKAKELNPDNYQIYQLFGEIYREEKNLEKTLSAFKMVSFIRPWDQTAKKTVRHLENILSQQHDWIEKHPDTNNKPNKSSLKNSGKSQRLKKLQKMLAHIEDIQSQQPEDGKTP